MSMKWKNKRTYNFIAILGLCVLLVTIPAVKTFCVTHKQVENLILETPDGEQYTIRTLHYSYPNNRFVSIRDMAAALGKTSKCFDVSISSNNITIRTGKPYIATGGENVPFEDAEYSSEGIKINPITIDDRECRYYTMMGSNSEGNRDAFINITDIAMILDADFKIEPSSGKLIVGNGDFYIDINEYIDQGLYSEVYSALVGEASTGTVFTAYNESVSVCAASTTKLMTYLCIMDAVSAGDITLDDEVVISKEAAALSMTSDGVIKMQEGQKAVLRDMLYGMLLPSSNEASLALAEHLDGSEEEFVKRMNNKARELGLSEATIFYNCNGLPEYSDTVAASKIQNHISAYDMFALASHIINKYPEIKEITTTTKYHMDAFGVDVENTNPLLYNLPGTVGLKTGTTKASGASLVSAYDYKDETGTHTIIAVEYGAEDASARNTVCEILIRYGIQCLEDFDINSVDTGDPGFPGTASELLRRIVTIRSNAR